MESALIIGSGPAAAGAALALSRCDRLEVTILDMGLELEPEREQLIDVLASAAHDSWDRSIVDRVSEQPVGSGTRGVPEKRRFGSNYPFRNIGQLEGLTADSDAGAALISAAYGGFSTVWGSQLMPFTAPTFDSWPFSAAAIRPHYEAILSQIPFAAEQDDLAGLFPLMGRPAPLPAISDRSQAVLANYRRHRDTLNRHGVTVGKARLAFDAENCVRCGLCMTGCPYGLIYSAAHTFDALTRSKRVTRRSGLIATKLLEQDDKAVVVAKEIATGRTVRFEADRIFVACGAMGTTRLVANSLKLFDATFQMGESQQFVLPLLAAKGTSDPRYEPDFTLNQFNMVIAMRGSAVDISQLHFYAYNPAFVQALPGLLRNARADRLQVALLRRLTVAFGYLPSWRSPRLSMRARPGSSEVDLPDMHVSQQAAPKGRAKMLRVVMSRLAQAAPKLDLYPVLPMLRLAAGGKSYHWGGSFPHGGNRQPAPLTSDQLGRVGHWKRIHLVDASVFPTVPAMTFTLTIMANAHRITSETLQLA